MDPRKLFERGCVFLVLSCLCAQAAIVIVPQRPSGTVTVTNSVLPAWLGLTQAVTHDESLDLTVNPSNGVFVSAFLTNTLTSDAAVTLRLPSPATTNALPMFFNFAVSSTTVTTAGSTNTLIVTDAGSTDCNQTYYWTASVHPDVYGGDFYTGYTNEINNISIIWVGDGTLKFTDPNVTDYYIDNAPSTIVGDSWVSISSGTDPVPTVAFGTGSVTYQYSLVLPANIVTAGGAPLVVTNGSSFVSVYSNSVWLLAPVSNPLPVVNP